MPLEFTDPAIAALDNAPAPNPDLDGLEVGDQGSELDDLDAELTATVAATALIEVLGRDGYAVRCRTDFTGRDLDNIRKQARDKRYSDGLDGIKVAGLLIALTAKAITRNGVDLVLDGESPVTFTSKPLQARYGTSSAYDTVRAFYGLEGHVDAAGRRLMGEAGWGDEVYAVDPTQ